MGWERKWSPTILADGQDLQPKKLWSLGEFDVVWCSPDCTYFSIAQTTAPRDFAKGNSIVFACFSISKHLNSNREKQVWRAVENLYTVFSCASRNICSSECRTYKRLTTASTERLIRRQRPSEQT